MKDLNCSPNTFAAAASGGGAYKYATLLREVLQRPCPKADELESLFAELPFCKRTILQSVILSFQVIMVNLLAKSLFH